MWLVIDRFGITLALFTELLIVGLTMGVLELGFRPLVEAGCLPLEGQWVYITIAATALVFHAVSCFSDPGSVQVDESQALYESLLANVQDPLVCQQCGCWKPPRIHHCSKCKRCIRAMHHHCPWINNCVGLYTQKNFILFLAWACLGCALGALTLIVKQMRGGLDPSDMPKLELLGTAFTFILTVGFGVMTGGLLKDQLKCVAANSSPIDEFLLYHFRKRPLAANYAEICGSNWLCWVCPGRPATQLRPVEVL